jgi:polyferredoxin/uncharacterized protein with FMN-binding domain
MNTAKQKTFILYWKGCKKMKLKITKKQIFRFAVQLIFFILFPALFILTYGAIKETYIMLIGGTFSFNELFPKIIEALSIIPVTVLFGRFFCGWFCAFGSFNEFIYNVSRRIFKVDFRINKKVDKYLKFVKYGILLFGLVFLWNSKSTFFSSLSPWEAFAQLKEFPGMLSTYAVSFIVLLLVMTGSVFIERFFCRYLCPLGAVFTIVSKLSVFKIYKPTEKCGNCSICTSKCSMGIELGRMEKVKSGECIYCLKCIDACSRKNPQIRIAKETVNPVLAGTIAISTLMGSYALNNVLAQSITTKNEQSISDNTQSNSNGDLSGLFGNANTDNNSTSAGTNYGNTDASAQSSSAAGNTQSKYKDGTYSGEGRGYRPGLEVSVTVKNSKIASVEILSNNETPRFAQMPMEIIPQEIVKAQSTSVDAVSGATRTSEDIMMAVDDALSQAIVAQG